jgi:tetratricopeptide (TPR) repeat protein
LHELLRQFSCERLDAAETDRTLDRHSDFFCRQLRGSEADLRGEAEATALRRMDEDIDNIRRAWRWAVDHGVIERMDEAAAALHHYVRRRARFEEGTALFADVDRMARTHGDGDATRVLPRLLAFQGDVLAETGQRDLAAERLRESLRLIESPTLACEDLRREQALALLRLAGLTDGAAEARPLHERSLSLYRQVGDMGQVALVLSALGFLWKSAGELEKAEACLEEGLKLRRTLQTPGLAAELSFHLGELRTRQGRHEESLRVFREGLTLARRADDRTQEIRGLTSMSTAYIHVGQFDQSEALLRQAIRIQQQLGCSSQLIEATALLGWSFVQQGRYGEAGTCAEQILAQVTGCDRHPGRGLASMLLGAGSLADGQSERARDQLMTAKEYLSVGWQVDWQGRRCVGQALLACCLCHLQQFEAARTELASALQTALQVRSLIAVIHLLPAAAFFYLKRTDHGRARQVFAHAWAQPAVANSRWFHQVLGGEFQKAGMLQAGKAPRTTEPHGNVQRGWRMAQRLRCNLGQDESGPHRASSGSNPGAPTSAQITPGPGPGKSSENNAEFVTSKPRRSRVPRPKARLSGT